MVMDLAVSPQNSYIEALLQVPQNVYLEIGSLNKFLS